jgi:hypothetical protein
MEGECGLREQLAEREAIGLECQQVRRDLQSEVMECSRQLGQVTHERDQAIEALKPRSYGSFRQQVGALMRERAQWLDRARVAEHAVLARDYEIRNLRERLEIRPLILGCQGSEERT